MSSQNIYRLIAALVTLTWIVALPFLGGSALIVAFIFHPESAQDLLNVLLLLWFLLGAASITCAWKLTMQGAKKRWWYAVAYIPAALIVYPAVSLIVDSSI